MNNILDEIIEKYMNSKHKKRLDEALKALEPACLTEFEEALELWKTYGGD